MWGAWVHVDSVLPMRRTPLLIAAAALAIAPLAACGGGGDDDATSPPAGGSTVTVHGSDALRYDKDSYSTTAGAVEIKLVNDGTQAHTLLVKDAAGETLPGFKLDTTAKKTGTIELESGKTYTLYCDIAGHTNMHSELAVK